MNLDGRRFVDETVGDHLSTLAVLDQVEARALFVCDQRVHDEWKLRPYVTSVQPIDAFELARRRRARSATADTLEELERLPEDWGYPGRSSAEPSRSSTKALQTDDLIQRGRSTAGRSRRAEQAIDGLAAGCPFSGKAPVEAPGRGGPRLVVGWPQLSELQGPRAHRGLKLNESLGSCCKPLSCERRSRSRIERIAGETTSSVK